MFTQEDLKQIADHGLTPELAETQLENFRRGFPFLNVVRAASPGDGVLVVGEAEADAAVERYEKRVCRTGWVKFVPASGAATRMFKELFEFVNDGKRGKGIDTLLENIGKFAFWPELRAVLPAGADDRAIVNAIVNDGLNYGRKPKGLVTFHAYPEGARKAVEEHLVEGGGLRRGGRCRAHPFHRLARARRGLRGAARGEGSPLRKAVRHPLRHLVLGAEAFDRHPCRESRQHAFPAGRRHAAVPSRGPRGADREPERNRCRHRLHQEYRQRDDRCPPRGYGPL